MRITPSLVILCVLAQLRQGQLETGKQLLVGYWGQNADISKEEKPLKWFCENAKYDVLILAFMDTLFIGEDKLPGLDFSHHCTTPVDSSHPHLLKCPKIEEDIKFCQSVGIPILLSVGGPTGDGTLTSPGQSRLLANNIWNLFLGAPENKHIAKLRTFGSAVLDGINLYIDGGRPDHYPDFVRELRMLMDSDTSKTYYITGTPMCSFPDPYLGPGPGTALGEAGRYFDHLYIRFYDDTCSTGEERKFVESLRKWLEFTKQQKPKGPLIFVGLPSAEKASSSTKYYRSPDELATMFKSLRTKHGIGGIMLWDCSWDQNIYVIEGRRYSEYAKVLLIDFSTESEPPTTKSSEESELPTTKSSEGPIDCSLLGDGTYPHETDCSKYLLCSKGISYESNCPPGLQFNKEKMVCDWPQNVTC